MVTLTSCCRLDIYRSRDLHVIKEVRLSLTSRSILDASGRSREAGAGRTMSLGHEVAPSALWLCLRILFQHVLCPWRSPWPSSSGGTAGEAASLRLRPPSRPVCGSKRNREVGRPVC
eukprot:264249-Hanusia_phi.AAC.1